MFARSLIFLGLATALVAAVPRAAAAETWPDRPITMVVPFPAGGPTDALGRIISERMGRALGQSIIVDNVSGAGGTLGVAKGNELTSASLSASVKSGRDVINFGCRFYPASGRP